MARHRAYIGVGSNLGDKRRHCRAGIAALARPEVGTLTRVSPFYRTSPVDFAHQDWFINAVIEIETPLTPENLMDALKRIERRAGRKSASVRFGPRELDMDILLYDNLVQNGTGLILPHPRLHKRRFVLQPLCDIAPDMLHPVVRQPMSRLLEQLTADDQRVEELSW